MLHTSFWKAKYGKTECSRRVPHEAGIGPDVVECVDFFMPIFAVTDKYHLRKGSQTLQNHKVIALHFNNNYKI